MQRNGGLGLYMVFINTTFSNISVLSRQSVLLVWETGMYRENHRPAASHEQSHNVVSSTPRLNGIWTRNLVVVGTYCIGSCKSNYHTITTTTTLCKGMVNHFNQISFDVRLKEFRYLYRIVYVIKCHILLIWWSAQKYFA